MPCDFFAPSQICLLGPPDADRPRPSPSVAWPLLGYRKRLRITFLDMEYSEKLKSPHWQKKRLKLFEQRGWKCQCCGDTESPLHVHHLVYSKGEPWDAPDDTLEVLCEGCHDFRTGFDEQWGRSRSRTAVAKGVTRLIATITKSKTPAIGCSWRFEDDDHLVFYITFQAEGEKSQGREAPQASSPSSLPVPQSPPVKDTALTGEAGSDSGQPNVVVMPVPDVRVDEPQQVNATT